MTLFLKFGVSGVTRICCGRLFHSCKTVWKKLLYNGDLIEEEAEPEIVIFIKER